MRVIFAAGGTAGHINPALAIADTMKRVFPGTEILFIGTPSGMESRLVTKAGYDFRGVEMSGFRRGFSPSDMLGNVKAAYRYLISAKRAVRKIIKEFAPELAVGTGGYVTATVLGQAAAMGVKTVTHESNSYPGMATKMLSAKADKVLLAVEDAKKYLKNTEKCVVTGNPLRTNIPIEEQSAARERLGLPEGFTVLSFGGSLGANKITEAVAELIAWETRTGGINHIHSFGSKNKDTFYEALAQSGVTEDKSRHIFRDYIDNMYTCMCAADLIISRAGAMTVTELTEIGRPSILVPYPAAAENHQYYNAMTLVNENAAILIEDKDLTKARLVDEVSRLYSDKGRLELMRANAARMRKANAADKILSEIIDLAGAERFA
ncbi:MAG: undecaprenyldiphospho-muramoylpentapeptide beta-N-acetylglucosaminyltransferase [Lachnospiraceae bacterium]|nr:undecaprenyldiphospho-muramoylpentapeptide beta-N-acetylglucosaminyltransferase [Ruminococcus sp.]MCM1275938.1 undecaprenyldiphospho-muramoylpentapeptide beta-N-acetylglucosaminyltransferase [Lachnospiraceae bacterium]